MRCLIQNVPIKFMAIKLRKVKIINTCQLLIKAKKITPILDGEELISSGSCIVPAWNAII